MRRQTAIGVTVVIGSLALMLAGPAAAESCAADPVTARGEPSRFEWLAAIHARGNWRSKVRALPNLGFEYANWSRAADQVQRCLSGGAGVVCELSARPCKP